MKWSRKRSTSCFQSSAQDSSVDPTMTRRLKRTRRSCPTRWGRFPFSCSHQKIWNSQWPNGYDILRSGLARVLPFLFWTCRWFFGALLWLSWVFRFSPLVCWREINQSANKKPISQSVKSDTKKTLFTNLTYICHIFLQSTVNLTSFFFRPIYR